MSGIKDTIRSDRLSVTFRLPRREPYSFRFDAAGCVERVVLDERHQFCEPEQILCGRPDHHGIGLVGEFKWDEIATETMAGELFPKFGVGKLMQYENHAPYSHKNDEKYRVQPCETIWELENDRAIFRQKNDLCLGAAAEITREYTVKGNVLDLTLMVVNTGLRPLVMHEYEHNFVSIDHIPIQPGYLLEIPWVRGLESLAQHVAFYGNRGQSIPDAVEAAGSSIRWKRSMRGLEIAYPIKFENIKKDIPARWTLYCDQSPAWIKGESSVYPERAMLWGIEHCICVEMYIPFRVSPGESSVACYRWSFGDECLPKSQ